MDKITTQQTYTNELKIKKCNHSLLNKIKFINEYTNYLCNFEGLDILGRKTVKEYIKKHLKGFKPCQVQ